MRCSFVKCSLQYPYCFKTVRFVLSGETYFWNNIVVLESNKQYIVKLKSHWRLKLIIPNNKYICILWYLMSDLILIFCLPLKHTLYSFKSQIFFLVYSKMCFKFLEGKALGKEGSCIFKTWFYKLICISLNFFFANLVENITWNFKGTAWSIQNLHLQLGEITYFSIIFFGSVGWGGSIYWQSLYCLLVSMKVHSEEVESVQYSST